MGPRLFDQYTLLHFAVGVVAYFFSVNFWLWLIIHTIFEIVENTHYGVKFINTHLLFWPGGKQKADSIVNSIGDTIGTTIGWLCAKALDKGLT